MDGHPGLLPLIGAGGRTESRLQAGSPSTCRARPTGRLGQTTAASDGAHPAIAAVALGAVVFANLVALLPGRVAARTRTSLL